MDPIKHLAHRAARSRRGHILDDIRYGWNNYSFIFYIGSISALLGSVFGIAGWASAITTTLLFYIAGKFKKQVDLERERIARKRKEER